MNKIINEIKREYQKNKIQTTFMGIIIAIAVLTYLKPGSTSGILSYIGLTAINFIVLSAIIVAIWYFWWRKK